MGFLLVAVLVLFTIAAIAAEVAVRITRHRFLMFPFVLAGLVPILAHMEGTTRYARHSDVPAAWPQLDAFRRNTFIVVAAATAVAALLIAVRAQLATVPLPLVTFWVYFRFVLPLAAHAQYGLSFYDNVPNVWMFIGCATASFALLVAGVRRQSRRF